jgi:hypothetical protein
LKCNYCKQYKAPEKVKRYSNGTYYCLTHLQPE